jgi:hypothetical protein
LLVGTMTTPQQGQDPVQVGGVPGIIDANQIREADGLDAILELVAQMRTVIFPAVILESRSSGSIQFVEGPLDTCTVSIWIMDRLGRGEDEAALYRSTHATAVNILKALLAAVKSGNYPALDGWDWTRISYMKRYGGPDARGWEIVLTFKENISLV